MSICVSACICAYTLCFHVCVSMAMACLLCCAVCAHCGVAAIDRSLYLFSSHFLNQWPTTFSPYVPPIFIALVLSTHLSSTHLKWTRWKFHYTFIDRQTYSSAHSHSSSPRPYDNYLLLLMLSVSEFAVYLLGMVLAVRVYHCLLSRSARHGVILVK